MEKSNFTEWLVDFNGKNKSNKLVELEYGKFHRLIYRR